MAVPGINIPPSDVYISSTCMVLSPLNTFRRGKSAISLANSHWLRLSRLSLSHSLSLSLPSLYRISDGDLLGGHYSIGDCDKKSHIICYICVEKNNFYLLPMECLLRARIGTRIGSNSLSSRLVPHKEGLNSIQSPTGLHKRPHLYTTCAFRQGGPEYVEDKNSQTMKSGIQSIEGPKWNSDALFEDAVEPFWEQLSLTFRVIYALGLYAGLAFAGQAICKFMGTDYWGGFDLNPETILQGLGYSVVPMMALLLLQDDEIVKAWPPARAVRDVEDGELMEYFEGMGWQFVPIVMAGALSEELFFRVAVQGGLTHAVQASASLNDTQAGLSALTAVVPSFAPFAQVIGVVLTSALTGSTYYLITAPKDPTYVIAPVTRGRKAFKDMKKRFEAWNERRQQRKIYSPLMESLLALYLGVEWLQTGNILAPMITHLVYSNVVIGHGLLRLHYQRVKLRQRVANILGKKSL